MKPDSELLKLASDIQIPRNSLEPRKLSVVISLSGLRLAPDGEVWHGQGNHFQPGAEPDSGRFARVAVFDVKRSGLVVPAIFVRRNKFLLHEL
jgi:hypothetical protein